MSARLLVVAPSAYPLGGVAVWLDYLLPGLAALGFDCTLGIASGEHHDAERYLVERPWKQVVAIHNRTGSAEGRRRCIADCIERLSPTAILGVNIADAFAAVRRVRWTGRHRPKLVMTLHGIEADLFADMKVNADLIDGVIASNHLACALSASVGGMDSKRVHYAPYGVPMQEQHFSSEWPSTGTIRVAWVGRFEQEQKRVFDVESVLDRLVSSGSQYMLRMVGDGPDRVELETRLSRFEDQGCVEWVGAVPSREMTSTVYRCSDVLLVTSMWETGPIIIWEAMASGVPVVASRYTGSGLEGALKDGENCLLFDLGDAVGAAAAIDRLRDPALRSRLVAAGRELVRNRYSIDASVAAWAQGIRSVIAAPWRTCEADVPPKLSGRLDRLLGVGLAESVRSLAGIRYRHADAGGEWPHSGSPPFGRDELWKQARAIDYPDSAGG